MDESTLEKVFSTVLHTLPTLCTSPAHPLPPLCPVTRYLQLPPSIQLHFVDSVEGLASMGRHLDILLHPHRHGSVHHSSPAAGAAGTAGGAAAAATEAQGEELVQAVAVGSAGAAGSSTSIALPASAAVSAALVGQPVADRGTELLPALGVDLEWQPDAESSAPPSLLQLSTGGLQAQVAMAGELNRLERLLCSVCLHLYSLVCEHLLFFSSGAILVDLPAPAS